ncbi:MAG: hypothetical protein GY839_06010 [candidate division Zixibacteria bacterium]|nr:hypothetical protein [candidate division Zixibacteria bacterium]
MNQAKRILLLVGSAKLERSTSEVLSTYITDKLGEKGFESETMFAHKILKSDTAKDELMSSVGKADLIILAFPLFVDCLPYAVISMLEHIANNRPTSDDQKKQSLMCVVNCGFPEAHQNDTAIAICRQFAHETDFDWAGGLAMGAGEGIHGRELSEVKGMARNVIKSLDLAVEDLAQSKPVSQMAIDLMAKPLVPRWMYFIGGSARWKREAKEHGVRDKMWTRPYEK